MKRIALIASGLLAAQAASAGVYVETVNRDIAAGTTTPKQKIYVQNGSGRFVDPEGRSTLIKGNTLYMIDDKDRSYIEFDKATMEQVAKKLSAQMEQLKAQMAKLPPEQRAQMEQMLGGAGLSGTPAHRRSNGHRQVGQGRGPCLQGLGRDTGWRSRRADLRGGLFGAARQGELLRRCSATSRRSFEEMAKSVPMLSGMMANEFSAYVKTNGYPVRQRAYDNGKLVGEETLVTVWREEAVPASTFEVPAGYTRKTMPVGPGQ